jgi:hypothetical protein
MAILFYQMSRAIKWKIGRAGPAKLKFKIYLFKFKICIFSKVEN